MRIDRITIRAAEFPRHDCYPYHLALFRETPSIDVTSGVTFLTGDNGAGKTTLLKALARKVGLHIWEAKRSSSAQFNPHAEYFHRYLDLAGDTDPSQGAFFAAESFRNFAELFDEWAANDPGLLAYFGGASFLTRSHGQGNMAYFSHRFKIPGLYLLDEPESALSPSKQLEFRDLLSEAAKDNRAQFIVATHSPILLSMPGATLLSFDSAPIKPVRFEETDYYRVYRGVLGNP